ncbi:MAG: hypothetical protein IJ789_06290 [Bacteroidales bacterium]|nr:hypothetical protein [Bacteroidales bacterium]
MKKGFFRKHGIATTLALLLLPLFVASCGTDSKKQGLELQPSQLYGLWYSESSVTHGYWRYNSNMTGTAWDPDEDVEEGESNTIFTWEVEEDQLTHIFTGIEGYQAVPKIYTVTAISDNAMTWKDSYGNIKTFTKQ